MALLLLLLLAAGTRAAPPTVDDAMQQVFAWNQLEYDIDGALYTHDTDFEKDPDVVHFVEEAREDERFFVQYNNVPVGLELDAPGARLFLTVPRRRYGIPSTLNYVPLDETRAAAGGTAPRLRPYPPTGARPLSVYRPRVDACRRLWVVDTGMLEIPGDRRQLRPPAIVVYDLRTDRELLRYELQQTDLLDERTPAGLTSIAVDASADACEDAHAYITDLATDGLVVFSWRRRDSRRLQHDSFRHDPAALNFTVAGHVVGWRDGVFSAALAPVRGAPHLLYHALASRAEHAARIDRLAAGDVGADTFQLLGSRGTQAGSHDYDAGSGALLLAGVALDAVLCFRLDASLTPSSLAVLVQDHRKLVYISDLKVSAGEVWLLVNQMPSFVYSTLDPARPNFFVHRARVRDLVRGTSCAPP